MEDKLLENALNVTPATMAGYGFVVLLLVSFCILLVMAVNKLRKEIREDRDKFNLAFEKRQQEHQHAMRYANEEHTKQVEAVIKQLQVSEENRSRDKDKYIDGVLGLNKDMAELVGGLTSVVEGLSGQTQEVRDLLKEYDKRFQVIITDLIHIKSKYEQ